MNLRRCAGTASEAARGFLATTAWNAAACEPLTGDASARQYFRLRIGDRTAILMDASRNRETVPPFVRIRQHLRELGFSVPELIARNEEQGLLLLEDFGDDTFARLLERCGSRADEAASALHPRRVVRPACSTAGPRAPGPQASATVPERLFTLATRVLIALHQHPGAVPGGLRVYDPERMLEDLEPFVQWRAPAVSEAGRREFRTAWREVLPLAHRVPASLLLRDYHAANLVWLREREGIRQAGLLDFQDAYRGPVTYDLTSLLEDARRDVPAELREQMIELYLSRFPALDRQVFETSMAVVAALRHTRVLAVFERLSRLEGKHEYRRLHSPRVKLLLRKALRHPMLAGVKEWMDRHAG